MTRESPAAAPLFTQVDVTPGRQPHPPAEHRAEVESARLLREILAAQDRQNELLEELISQLTASQRQRNQELGLWKSQNPRLANGCRQAAEALGRVQSEFLEAMVAEIDRNAEAMTDGEFVFNEFIDRFGPRLAHLNGVLQVLVQLSSGPQANS